MMGNERSLLIIFYSTVFSFLGLDTKFYAPCAAQLLSSVIFRHSHDTILSFLIELWCWLVGFFLLSYLSWRAYVGILLDSYIQITYQNRYIMVDCVRFVFILSSVP